MGKEKARLLGGLVGAVRRLVRFHVAVRDTVIVVFCGIGQGHQAIRLHPVSGAFGIDSADCPFVGAAASNLNFASGFFLDEFCNFAFDLVDCGVHRSFLSASGLFRSMPIV